MKQINDPRNYSLKDAYNDGVRAGDNVNINPTAPEKAQTDNGQGFGGDVVDSIQYGLAQAGGGLAETAYQLTDAELFADARDASNNWGKSQLEQMSPEGREAMTAQIFEESAPDASGETSLGLGEGATNWKTWALQLSSLAGQMVPQIALGGGFASLGAKVAGKVVFKSAARKAVAEGATKEASILAGKKAAEAAFATARGGAGVVGYAAVGTAIAGGMIGNEVRDEVMEMTNEQLDQSNEYRKLYYQLQDMQPELGVDGLRDLTKRTLADRTATTVQKDPMLITSNLLMEAVGGKFLDDIFRGVGSGSRSINAGKQFAVQGSTEAAQGGIEKYASNAAIIDEGVDPYRDAFQGVKGAAANEGILGGALGGVMGAASKGEPLPQHEPLPTNNAEESSNTAESMQSETVEQPQPTMTLDEAVEQIKAERSEYRGIDDDIAIAQKQGFDEEAVRLRAAKRNFEMAQDLMNEGDRESAMRFRERGLKIYRDVMEPNSPDNHESSNLFPAEYVATGDYLQKEQQPPVYPVKEGETIDAPVNAIENKMDASVIYSGRDTTEIDQAKAKTEAAFTSQHEPELVMESEGESEVVEAEPSIPMLDHDNTIYAPQDTTERDAAKAKTEAAFTQQQGQEPGEFKYDEVQQDKDQAVNRLTEIIADIKKTNVQDVNIKGERGRKGRVKIGDNYQPVTFKLVDMDANPALKPTISRSENQFRDRNRAASDTQIASIAAKLDFNELGESPRMTSGAPTLSREGRIIGGNGRMAAIRKAYAGKAADNYKAELKKRAKEFGINPASIDKMKSPVLIRQFDNPVDIAKTAIESNNSGTMDMSALEQAAADSTLIPNVPDLEVDDSGNINWNNEGNRRSIRGFISVLPQSSQNSLLKGDGTISPAGIRRFENLLTYKAFGQNQVLDNLIENAKEESSQNIKNVLQSLAPRIAMVRQGMKRGDYHNIDITDHLVEAIELLESLRASSRSVSDYMAQLDMVSVTDPVTNAIAQELEENIRTPKALREQIKGYYDSIVAAGHPDQSDMFGTKSVSLTDLVGLNNGESNTLERDAGQDGPGTEYAPAPQETQSSNDSGRTETEPTTSEPDAGTEEELLTSYSEEDIATLEAKNKAASDAKAKAELQADQKAKADAEANDFKLSGSDRTADVAAAEGQNSLFDTAAKVDQAASEAATSQNNDTPEPTEAQQEAGNYKKGHVTIQGLDIAIENERGSERKGTDPDGNEWAVKMAHHYGYIKKTTGADGDHVDVFIGKNPDSEKVFVVDQVNPDGTFDEHKVMLGFNNKAMAITGYKSSYEKGWKVGPIKSMTMAEFKDWLKSGDTKKPSATDIDGDTKEAVGRLEANVINAESLVDDLNKQLNDVAAKLKEIPSWAETGRNNRSKTLGKKIDNLTRKEQDIFRELQIAQNNLTKAKNTLSGFNRGTLHENGKPKSQKATEEQRNLEYSEAIKAIAKPGDNLQYILTGSNEKIIKFNKKTVSVDTWAGKQNRPYLDFLPIVDGKALEPREVIPTAERMKNSNSEATSEQRKKLTEIANDFNRGLDNVNKTVAKKAKNGDFVSQEEAQAAIQQHTNYQDTKAKKAAEADAKEQERANKLYGNKTKDELIKKLDDLQGTNYASGEISDGNRSTRKAVNNEAARSGAEEAMKLERFIKEKFGDLKPEQKANKKPSKNTVFTEDAAEKARAILKAKLGQMNSGLDPEIMQAGITLAGFHIEKGARSFAAFAKAMVEDLGDTVKPYLKSWYMGVKYDPRASDFDGMSEAAEVETTNINDALLGNEDSDNAEHTASSKEPDSGKDDDQTLQDDIFNEGRGRVRQDANESGNEASEAQQKSSSTVGSSSATTTRKSSDKQLHNEKPELEGSTAGGVDDSGSLPDSTGGLFAEQEASGAVERVANKTPVKILKLGSKPKGLKSQAANKDQIKERMPFLTDGQAEDVAITEKRFSKDDGYGMMFTNGTGTGKTFTGLGVIRRFVDEGKGNILIMVPKQTIASAWIKEGAKFFDLSVNRLDDIEDAGKGVVVTTYANASSNDAIVGRDWDLIVADESHYLSSDQKGSSTGALKKLRAISLKESSAYERTLSLNPELTKELSKQSAMSKDPLLAKSVREEAAKSAGNLNNRLFALAKKEADRLANIKPKDKPRALFLSATPFAYDKNVIIGQEFLFDWGNDRGLSGSKSYNHANNYEDFMITHFGYRMRYGKLTQPDAKVDKGLMERAFNTWLKKEGALSGRSLDSDFDYDRRFILVENQIGKRVDDALAWLSGRDIKNESDERKEARRKLEGIIATDNFKYHSRMYFLEALKAREAIPHVKAYLNAGFNVLLMHDYKKGGAINPFIVRPDKEIKDIYAEFKAEFSDLIYDFQALPSPIELIAEEFPDALIYNGGVSAKKRVEIQNKFNDDNNTKARVMLAQGDAMREGVSIHDTTGKHQRVMLHLGMPVKPTAAIQQEGRTYRTGQASDAVFRYFSTGTNWERFAFATTISQRAGTAENLAMGEQARGLKESFIDAYEEAGDWGQGAEGEGKGGKAKDEALANILTPWDMAKSYYFGTKKQGSGRSSAGREGADYFATPEPLGMKMVQWADIKSGESVLEPSGGHGAIGRWFPENTNNKAIEQSSELASKLALRFNGDVLTGDFEDHSINNKYDAIVMNPPYGRGGKDAADHVRKAMKHTRNGGRIVALVPTGPAADKQFNKLLKPADPKKDNDSKDFHIVASIAMPQVTFERAGTRVATRVLILEKQTDEDAAKTIRQQNQDYTDFNEIEDFFDSLEGAEVDPRAIVKPKGGEPLEVSDDVSFVRMNSTHTKNGSELFVVNLEGDMGDSYERLNDLAKENGGFYVRAKLRNFYKPNDGSEKVGTPTFVFKSDEGRDAFLSKAGESTALASLSSDKVAASIKEMRESLRRNEDDPDNTNETNKPTTESAFSSVDDVKAWVAETEKFLGKKVNVVANKMDLPIAVKFRVGVANFGKDFDAIYDQETGETWINANQIMDKEHAIKTVLHETLGHGGVIDFLNSQEANGGKEVTDALEDIYRRAGKKLINRDIERYGLDYTDKKQRQTAVLEYIAHLAETGKKANWMHKVIGAIKNAMRKIFPNISWTDLDTLLLLEKGRRHLRENGNSGNGKGGDGGALMRLSDAIENDTNLTDQQKAFLDKIGPKSLKQTAVERLSEVMNRWRLKMRQGLVDRFAALLEMDKKILGGNVTSEDNITSSSWVRARMSNGASGAVSAMMSAGRIYLDEGEGVIDVKQDTNGLVHALNKLGGAAEVEKFFGWIAANRAEKLAEEGRENLFTDEDIQAGKVLNQGLLQDGRSRNEVYDQVFTEFQQHRDDILAIAEKAGIITPENREMWANEFYVPFYRVMEDDDSVQGAKTMGGLSRQQAYKKLKGGSQNVNDLLQNTIMNFHHLVDASLKNLAAAQAMDNALELEVATPTNEATKSKQATFVLREGEKVWYDVHDDLVFQSLTALNSTGMNGAAMKAMRWFKRIFTNMTTSTPQFLVANLLRDSLSSMAVADLKFNPAGNVASGIKSFGLLDKTKYERARLLATGGAFSFGHIYGEDADSIRYYIDGEMRRADIVKDPAGLLKYGLKPVQAAWDRWQDVSNSFENANRMAAFKQAEEAGKGKLYAAHQSRDMMDFSGIGAWPAVRFLVDVVPFMNARLQGLDKLYRAGVKPTTKVVMNALGVGDVSASLSEKKAAARFMAVVGALSMATMALYLRNKDDEEYQKLEEWHKDSYWWFRIGDNAITIPKPFEVGAIATLTERLLEQAVDDKATGKLFAERFGHMLSSTFAFNPIPQMIQPTIDVYANKDSFTGRQIETMGQQRLSPSMRTTDRTTAAAELLGKGMEAALGADSSYTLSPIQIDYLIGGYFGQVGAWAVGHGDVLRNALSDNERPAKHWYEYQPIRRFYKNLGDPHYDKQQSLFYDALRDSSRIYADLRQLRTDKETESYQSLKGENKDLLSIRKQLNRTARRLSAINARIKRIKADDSLGSDEKRRQIDLLKIRKNALVDRTKRLTDSLPQ